MKYSLLWLIEIEKCQWKILYKMYWNTPNKDQNQIQFCTHFFRNYLARYFLIYYCCPLLIFKINEIIIQESRFYIDDIYLITLPCLGVIQQVRGPNFTQFWSTAPSSGQLWIFYMLPNICHVNKRELSIDPSPLFLST